MKTFTISLFVIVISLSSLIAPMAKPAKSAKPAEETKVYIIFTEKPTSNEDLKTLHLRTLASVVGSEGAAKKALVYSYKNAASGFSAKLTTSQVEKMSKQPGVIRVLPSMNYRLLSGGGSSKLG